MPYVQRNWKGEIIGLYGQPQLQSDGSALTEPKHLPDDHPDVIAFREKYPIPREFLKPLTAADWKRIDQMHKKVQAEHEAIRDAVSIFNNAFAELEIALSALLYASLNITKSQVAYAIYYSPISFDARCDMVENVVIQLAIENKPLVELADLWAVVADALGRTRRLRNAIAHSSPNTLAIREKQHARLTASPFDVIRVGRPIALGRIPGLKSNEIRVGIKTSRWTRDRIDEFNLVFATFHDVGNPTLPEKLSALKRGLQKLDNQ